MEIINRTLDSILVKCHNIQVENIKYGELVVLVESDDEYSGYSDDDIEELNGEYGDIANESSVEDVLEIVRQATIKKKEPTIYEIEFENVSNSSGRCNFDELVKFLHKLGLSPTVNQCEELKKEFGTNNIDIESALKAYNKTSADKYTQEELLVSLKSTKPEITRKRLVILLQTFGDKMTEDEINRALDKLEIGNEPIKKDEFIEKLCIGSKQIKRSDCSNKSKENLNDFSEKNDINNDQKEELSQIN
ncbi:myosin regulatory light chain [Cryptosporidium ubiquitum]|uniref:Myosin regulatory light chain n=1 Tax=Cryptosporidium ubiquitum TaxID=857276 RepID=A0A1J4ML89_9CRYT|nr:myosin regulatory light chain [Cryptosporidium ubiquitum]OII74799.1 myosin regulatory light chain [Cryptosporidium ubiquitum]